MSNHKAKLDPASISISAGLGASSGRFAYDGLERLIHEKARLSIMTSLSTRLDGVLFPELKDLCSLTDGNLSRHLQHLQEAGLVELLKGHKGNRPQTLCRLTREGRRRFLEYVTVLENVVADAVAAASKSESDTEQNPNPTVGWSPA